MSTKKAGEGKSPSIDMLARNNFFSRHSTSAIIANCYDLAAMPPAGIRFSGRTGNRQ
jgi:hypothetical protein